MLIIILTFRDYFDCLHSIESVSGFLRCACSVSDFQSAYHCPLNTFSFCFCFLLQRNCTFFCCTEFICLWLNCVLSAVHTLFTRAKLRKTHLHCALVQIDTLPFHVYLGNILRDGSFAEHGNYVVRNGSFARSVHHTRFAKSRFTLVIYCELALFAQQRSEHARDNMIYLHIGMIQHFALFCVQQKRWAIRRLEQMTEIWLLIS